MSVREQSPLFQWGFSFRARQWLIPLFSTDLFTFGKEAVCTSHPAADIFPDEEKPLITKKSIPLFDTDLFSAPAGGAVSARSTNDDDDSQSPCSTIIAVRKNVDDGGDADGDDDDDDSASASSTAAAATTTLASSTTSSLSSSGSSSSSSSKVTGMHRSKSCPVLTISEHKDEEIIQMVRERKLAAYKLESTLGDTTRAVDIRRKILENDLSLDISRIPFEAFDYDSVWGRCCENVIGYVSLPVGVAGPLLLDDEFVHIPMATTEGCLVASTHRGCKAISVSGGARTIITANGMTRGPCLRMPSARAAGEMQRWLEDAENFARVAESFNGTSRFARLKSVKVAIAGRNVYVRFKSSTGDAMGMNMVSKGVEAALTMLATVFPELEVMSLSGNYCIDKKPAAINWIDGRGKSVTAEAIISGSVLRTTLKTDVDSIVRLNTSKNLIGSAMAGAIGGFNAHSSNVVTAIFIATGQDPAQNIESSNCITTMEPANGGKDLYISVTMPSVEVGTVGGGTHLPAQAACLDIVDAEGASPRAPGEHANRLAKVVAGGVLAGELSLMAALAAGHLTKSHMALNRAGTKKATIK